MRRISCQKPLVSLSVLALMGAVTLLTPLAYAVPPDPVWVSGVFDDDDSDNGVFLVTSGTATLDPFPLYAWVPFPVHWPGVEVEAARPGSPPYVSSADARASPLD
jgi:hypothetical protein